MNVKFMSGCAAELYFIIKNDKEGERVDTLRSFFSSAFSFACIYQLPSTLNQAPEGTFHLSAISNYQKE